MPKNGQPGADAACRIWRASSERFPFLNTTMQSFRIPGQVDNLTANSTPAVLGMKNLVKGRISPHAAQQLVSLSHSPLGMTAPVNPTAKPRPANVQAMIDLIYPAAQDVYFTWGVPISICIAQAGLETGWGAHVKGNAYFGIKGKSPTGASTTFATTEYTDPKTKVSITDTFRAYQDLDEAADDYGRFLKTNRRYAAAFLYVDDPIKFAEVLQSAHYGTDPLYAAKIKTILTEYQLHLLDPPSLKLYANPG